MILALENKKESSKKKSLSSKKAALSLKKFNIGAKGKALNYQVIASPSYQQWLYGLAVTNVDRSKKNGPSISIKDDYTLYNKEKITQTFSYHAASYLTSPLSLELSEQEKLHNLQFPQWDSGASKP